MSEQNGNGNHGQRIARLETAVAAMAEGQTNMQKTLDNVSVKLDTVGRWNIGQLAAIIGTTVLLIGAIGSPYIQSIVELKENQKELINDQQEIAKTRWERKDAERANDILSEGIKDNERRLGDDIIALSKYVDERDQHILALAQSEIREVKTDLASRSGRRWNRDEHDKYVAPRLDRHDERLRGIETEVAGRKQTIEKVNANESEILRLRDKVEELQIELARRSAAIDFVEAEQARRRPLVYDKDDK